MQQSDVLIEERAFAFIVFGVPVILTQDQMRLYNKTADEIKEEFHVYIYQNPAWGICERVSIIFHNFHN